MRETMSDQMSIESPATHSEKDVEYLNAIKDLLTPEQALLYQAYAAELQGLPFSDKASTEAYDEAEQLLQRLRSSDFNWLNIDWDTLDFKKVVDVKNTEERLDTALRLLVKESDPEEKSLLAQYLKRVKFVLPLALSVFLLLSPNFARPTQAVEQDYDKKISKSEQVKQDSSIDSSDTRCREMLFDFKKMHPEIGQISLITSTTAQEEGGDQAGDYQFASSKAIIKAILSDGRTIEGRGSARRNPTGAIDPIVELVENGINRALGTNVELRNFDYTVAVMTTRYEAVDSALFDLNLNLGRAKK